MDLQSRFEDIADFLSEHKILLQSEPLNHYPDGIPSPYCQWTSQLKKLDPRELISIECDLDFSGLSGDFSAYISKVQELSKFLDRPAETKQSALFPSRIEIGMTLKKRHEASRIAGFLEDKYYKNYLDIGSGKGHLSMALLASAPEEAFPKSRCLDLDSLVQEAGRKKLKKHAPEMLDKIEYICSRFEKAAIETKPRELAIGLHCCGDLSVELIRHHLNSGSDLLNFGCCYHKSTQLNLSAAASKKSINFSFHALNLATRSNRKMTVEDYRRRTRVKLYRYALHMILADELNESFSSVGNARHNDYDLPFSRYCAKHAPRVLELDIDLDERYAKLEASPEINELILAETIRGPLGRLAELYILLDRAIHLQEFGRDVEIKCFFDPKLSPRNIGIFSKCQ